MLQIVRIVNHELNHNEQGARSYESQIEFELRIAKKALEFQLGYGKIQKSKIHARKEAEDCTSIFHAR